MSFGLVPLKTYKQNDINNCDFIDESTLDLSLNKANIDEFKHSCDDQSVCVLTYNSAADLFTNVE